MVDSLFLLYFLLGNEFYSGNGIHIKCDILKLENHIPLFALREFFEKFELSWILCLEGGIRELLWRVCKVLFMFDIFILIPAIPKDTLMDSHLLGSFDTIVSPFLKIELISSYPSLLQLQPPQAESG